MRELTISEMNLVFGGEGGGSTSSGGGSSSGSDRGGGSNSGSTGANGGVSVSFMDIDPTTGFPIVAVAKTGRIGVETWGQFFSSLTPDQIKATINLNTKNLGATIQMEWNNSGNVSSNSSGGRPIGGGR
ncbi:MULTISPECIES: hypothetical protein [Rhizobium]|jgi:hypothetical protein|uniref:Uncharacterized protein n=1 Tax=Rhizobium lusitanum TaxID=293958 RepID=A0A1C3XJM8_9HYPH|nr:hypothetical protein [Rhizobium lusitanum]MBM7046169.1 hypothetical protein [Rhizobium lusitanum]SCB52409.1 hypothetical protein GA0061101_14927 [Rhizobium lusitanum]